MGLENSGQVTSLSHSPNLHTPLLWKEVVQMLAIQHSPSSGIPSVTVQQENQATSFASEQLQIDRCIACRQGQRMLLFIAGAIHSSSYSCDPALLVLILVLNKAHGSLLSHPQAVKQVNTLFTVLILTVLFHNYSKPLFCNRAKQHHVHSSTSKQIFICFNTPVFYINAFCNNAPDIAAPSGGCGGACEEFSPAFCIPL